jgi:hypothetical protein
VLGANLLGQLLHLLAVCCAMPSACSSCALHARGQLLQGGRRAVHPVHGFGDEPNVHGGPRLALALLLQHLFL